MAALERRDGSTNQADRDAEAIRTRFGELHEQLFDVVLSQIERQRYPSSEMLDLIEAYMTVEDRARLAEILIDKVGSQRYPSLAMLQHVAALVRT
jgi:hypothetical protein